MPHSQKQEVVRRELQATRELAATTAGEVVTMTAELHHVEAELTAKKVSRVAVIAHAQLPRLAHPTHCRASAASLCNLPLHLPETASKLQPFILVGDGSRTSQYSPWRRRT